MITDLIDKLTDLISEGCNAGSIQIRLVAIRLAAQNLIADHEKLRQTCDELQKIVYQEVIRRNQTTEVMRAQLPPETISTQLKPKRSTQVKSRLRKLVARKSKKHRGDR